MIFPLENDIQPYPWGSPTAIPELFGLANPDHRPMAELWMGAHPKAPSRICAGDEKIPLDTYVAEDPVRALGTETARRHGDRLPFLFKILAAAEPLSIQAHPTLAQARAGYARENADGIPLDAPNRNYRDDNHKPELICALSPFWGLRGFRSAREIAARFAELPGGVGGLVPPPRDDEDIAAFFRSLMTLDGAAQRSLLDAAVAHARSIWPNLAEKPVVGDAGAPSYWVQRLAEKYPGDVGVLAPLFLNVFSLRPGEATYQPAGVLHAYLEGVGAELMANSDNVLRGGLTVKHIDLDELMRIGVFRPEDPVTITGTPRQVSSAACAERIYEAPFEEFLFSQIDLDGECRLDGERPLIIFCSGGHVTLDEEETTGGNSAESGGSSSSGTGGGSSAAGADATTVELRPGQSAFVPAAVKRISLDGRGTLLCATVGETA